MKQTDSRDIEFLQVGVWFERIPQSLGTISAEAIPGKVDFPQADIVLKWNMMDH